MMHISSPTNSLDEGKWIMNGKNEWEICKGQLGWLFHGFFILYHECYLEKLNLLKRGWMNTFIYIFHHKFLHMSLAHGATNSTPNEHKGMWKMSKIGVLFFAALKRTFFPPLKSCQIFWFHLIHLMNMYDHRSKHVFIVKKI
jgi:hypothetical protein